ncbi:hypothetical protein ACF0H5_020521 [Mactra antiquata]
MQIYLIVLIGYLISTVLGQYYFVTLPNVIRFNNEEVVSVNVFNLVNARIEVWLELKEGHNVRKIWEDVVLVRSEDYPETIKIKVLEKDILHNEQEEDKPTSVKVCSRYDGKMDCQEIPLSYDTGYLLIHTDKTIYTPNQRVGIRALAFDESLQMIKDQPVWMDIISPSDDTLGRVKKINSTKGFYSHHFILPPRPEIGIWTARAYHKGQYETTAKAVFKVEEYVLPTYGVTIDVNVPFILSDTKKFKITVKARYVYGKPVKGNARLDMYLCKEGDEDQPLLSTNRKKLSLGVDDSASVFNINTSNIMATQAVDNVFPGGKKLKIIATVYEAETGIEENDLHDKTLFTSSPYIFKFTRSKMNFRPGMEYYLKVELIYANGAPVIDQVVSMAMDGGRTVSGSTDPNGRITETFETTGNKNKIKFKVSTTGFGRDWSDEFEVTKYEGTNQIEVELANVNGQSELRAYTNSQGDFYTGMLFMVVTRGKIVKTAYKSIGNKVSIQFPDELKQMVSPSGRLLVFYVDKRADGEIVVDSVKFDVEHVCRGKGLSLVPTKTEIVPGEKSNLQIFGDPSMFVGLNVMDKALLLLNKENTLKRDTLFNALDSHDLGCGEGSGSNSADVFKRAGLTVLTNAHIDKQLLKGKPEECDLKHRVRRLAENYCTGEYNICCDEGEAYADEVIASKKEMIDPLVTCYSRARSLQNNDEIHSSIKCVTAIFFSCFHVLERHSEGKPTGPRLRSNDMFDANPYTEDLNRATEIGGTIRTRKDFRESWEFTIRDLDKKGNLSVVLNYPDSITEWMIQAIGISKKGVCIAEPAYVKSFRNFFIQLYLPYKAKRLEQMEVKATIFNYESINMTAHVYLTASKYLCYDSGYGIAKPSRRIIVEIPSNDAQTVRFPVIPLKKGQFDVTASAFVNTGLVSYTDEVKKLLLVDNEGIEEKITIQVCLDPHKEATDCKQDKRVVSDMSGNEGIQILKVNLDLPKNAIPSTGSGTAYFQGTVIENTIQVLLQQGVNHLLKLPTGCGEQTLLKLAPNIYAMNYMKQTKTMTEFAESNGTEFIRFGINREKSMYRKLDGSYTLYPRTTNHDNWLNKPSSTWLTAFVAKIFCQAKKIVDDAVDTKDDIEDKIKWIVSKMNADGSFIENLPVITRSVTGSRKEKVENANSSLPAFVLVALQECSHHVAGFQHTVNMSMQYIENLDRQMLRNNPYILAISTYALALSNSSKRFEFLQMLKDIKRSSDNAGTNWGYAANAASVETTSYALLAMLQFGDYKLSGDIVKWLTSHRDAKGAFYSTQDTVVGLQALSEYSIKTASRKLNLKVSLMAEQWKHNNQIRLTHENVIFQKNVGNLPVEIGKKQLTIKVEGQGTGRMMIDLRYNRHGSKNERCGFTVSDIIINDVDEVNINIEAGGKMECDVCGKNCDPDPYGNKDQVRLENEPQRVRSNIGRKKRSNEKRASKCAEFSISSVSGRTGMAVVIFGLETGVEVISDDIDKLVNEIDNIDAYEYDGKGFVVFYLSEITTNETSFKFRLKDTFDDKAGKQSRQPAVVTIYDYYNPDQTCTKMYRSEGETLSLKCDDSSMSMSCQCMNNMCPLPMRDKLEEQARDKNKPVKQLKDFTCNAEQADYAMLVRIDQIDYEDNLISANAFVTKSIHGKNLANEEVTLFYPMHCSHPNFTVGDESWVIGKDFNNKFEYPLIGTTLVIEKTHGGSLSNSVMKIYEGIMKRGCDT